MSQSLVDVLQSVKALAIFEGLRLRQSPSGSLYIRNTRGEEWRISDHELTGDRNIWRSAQIIVRADEFSPSPSEILKRILRGTIDWYEDSI